MQTKQSNPKFDDENVYAYNYRYRLTSGLGAK